MIDDLLLFMMLLGLFFLGVYFGYTFVKEVKDKSNRSCDSCLNRICSQDCYSLCNECKNFDKYESFEDCIAEGRYIRTESEVEDGNDD